MSEYLNYFFDLAKFQLILLTDFYKWIGHSPIF